MRRLFILLVTLSAAIGGTSLVAPAGPAVAQAGRDRPGDPRLGLVYDDLRAAPADSLCRGAFEAFIDANITPGMKQVLCTHGPDPAPDGIDVRDERGPDPAAELAAPGVAPEAQAGALACVGTGSDGYRVQLVYARSSAGADRYSTFEASFRAWAARMDQVVNDSAAATGGTRHVRFVTDSACNPVISRVALSSSSMSSFGSMVSELHSKGYSRSDRKYVVWTDANVYCGISEIYTDDTADPTPGRNYNNGNPWIQGAIGRIDNGCWGLQNLVEAHELLHLLGGVQPSAPHATPGFHCTDEYDRLCYADGSGGGDIRYVCPSGHEALYDCNHDDYFNTAPLFGSYLSTHWNTAASAFLSGQGTGVTTTTRVPPPTTTTVPPTTTTVPPTTTTTATTTTITTTTTTTTTVSPTTTAPPPTTSTTQPPDGSRPSAPQSPAASQPRVGTGVQLAWRPPAAGPVSGYRVYRGTTPWTLTLLAEVGNVTGYADTSAARTMYYYRVTALNAAGEGPSSSLAGMIGKSATPAGAVREDIDRRLLVSESRMGVTSGWAIAARR